MNQTDDHAQYGASSIPAGDLWFGEYYAPDVRFALQCQPLARESSPYQQIDFYQNATFGTFFTLNGFVQVTARDEFIYHDMIVHPAMAVNPDIRRVLIIGGGDGGTAREVSRYPGVEKIDMVEIDEAVIRLCRRYLPQTAAVFDQEPRLHLTVGNGVDFVAQAADGAYDLLLVDSTDPVGPGEGLFTTAFYRDCYRILSDRGIMINQQEGAFYPQDRWEMQRAHKKVDAVFPVSLLYGFNMPTYASGYWYFGFASKGLHPLDDLQAGAWRSLGLQTKYYNEDIHRASFALPNYVRDVLRPE
ncbi:MAG: polyamine aminopropyltransferase [Firmicutes bacterium]|nr:polyamine aminopropyltransferase [Bacillota bacterium]